MGGNTTGDTTIRTVLPAGIGLGCWLVTTLFHANNFTPFQRFDGTASFIGDFVRQSLVIGAVIALICAVLALRRHCLPKRVAALAGGILFVAGTAGFCIASLIGIPDGLGWLTWILAGIVALGSIATGLIWGRVFKSLTPRLSLIAIAVAAVTAALLAVLAIAVPAAIYVALFILEALAAVTVPGLIGQGDPGCDVSLSSKGTCQCPLGERLGSFARVASPALIGLFVFAFVAGSMRSGVADTYGLHYVVLLMCGIVLGICALMHTRRPLISIVYRSIIPILAVLMLAESSIALVLQGGSEFNTAMDFLLYLFAGFIALAMLSAIAHADEFSCDALYSMALMLFCLASFAGVSISSVMDAQEVSITTAVITTIYALAMVLIAVLRNGRRAAYDRDNAILLGSDIAMPPGGSAGEPYTVEERCSALAWEYHLTAREEEILVCLAKGYRSGHISETLYISQNTVRTHIHNIYLKFGINTREEILARIRK